MRLKDTAFNQTKKAVLAIGQKDVLNMNPIFLHALMETSLMKRVLVRQAEKKEIIVVL